MKTRSLFHAVYFTALASLLWIPTITYSQAGPAESAFKSRDYVKACSLATQVLVSKSNNQKAKEVLLMAYPAAVDEVQSFANVQATSAQSPDRGGIFVSQKIIEKYREILKLNREIQAILPIQDKKSGEIIPFELVDFSGDLVAMEQQLIDVRNKAAEIAYNRGTELIQLTGRENYKQAAISFKDANEYIFNYKDASARYQEARQKATQTLVVDPSESSNMTGKNGFNDFKNKVVYLVEQKISANANITEFTKLVNASRSGGQSSDLTLQIILLNINIGTPQTSTRQFGETRNVKVGEKQVVENGKTKTKGIYEDVQAAVTEYTRTIESSIELAYKLTDTDTGEILSSNSATGSFSQRDVWASATGDARALSNNTKQLINAASKIPSPPPSQNQLETALAEAVSSLVGILESNLR